MGKLLCQILFHGLWICAAEARTQQSLSHAEAQTTGLISPPDLWKLHFFFFFFLNYLFLAAKDSVGQWSRSEVDGKFVALTAVCSTHGCVQLCEDAKAVRVSPMDAAVYICTTVVGVLYVHLGLESDTHGEPGGG